jgi:hypothetical protein
VNIWWRIKFTWFYIDDSDSLFKLIEGWSVSKVALRMYGSFYCPKEASIKMKEDEHNEY